MVKLWDQIHLPDVLIDQFRAGLKADVCHDLSHMTRNCHWSCHRSVNQSCHGMSWAVVLPGP